MSKLTVSRRAYLLSHPSANAMRAAGTASTGAARHAMKAHVKGKFAALLADSGSKV